MARRGGNNAGGIVLLLLGGLVWVFIEHGKAILVILGVVLAIVVAIKILAALSKNPTGTGKPLDKPAAPEPTLAELVANTPRAAARARPAPPPTPAMRPRWIPLGEAVTLPGGQVIPGGGFYLGSGRGLSQPPAGLVDPELAVRLDAPDWTGARLTYYPTYAQLDPRDRGTFIAFLASRRDATTVGIGFVFLYFYGIEYRLMQELTTTAADPAEVAALVAELERLRRCYGANASINRYTRDLIEIAPWATGVRRWDSPGAIEAAGLDWSIPVRWAIGQLLMEGQALPPDWAFLWARHLTLPAQSRTWDVVLPELRERFAQLYLAAHPGGLRIPPPRSTLAAEYTWASAGRGSQTIRPGVPDPDRLTAPVRPLSGYLLTALGELEELKRVRRSKLRTAASELAALPKALRSQALPPALRAIGTELRTAVAAGVARRPLAPIATGLGLVMGAKPTRKAVTELLQALDVLGIGMEPDQRFGSGIPDPEQDVFLFALPAEAPQAPSQGYAAVLLVVQAALAVGDAEGALSDAEVDAAMAAIEAQFDLHPAERARLGAVIARLRAYPSPRRIDAKLKALPEADRAGLAQVMLDVASADGQISASEVRLIERFYKAIGLDPASVPADLHRASLGQARQSAPAAARAALDPDRIAAKLAETARVQAALSEIFRPDEPEPAPEPIAAEESGVAGLDAPHSALLRALLDAGDTIDRAAYEALCEAHDLLPEGALERINEIAFEHAGEALAEGDDPIDINPYARDILGPMANGGT